MTRGIFVLDLDRCTGCAACVVACNNENQISPAQSWRRIHTFNSQRLPQAPVFHYSFACNHCGDPACLNNCPASAFSKDQMTGAVLINQDRCMGCRYCSWVCPYDALRFDHDAGVMEKCTFCSHRLGDFLSPACAVACPTDALRFECHDELPTVDRRGFPETGLSPSVLVTGDRREDPPHMTARAISTSGRAASWNLLWSGFFTEWSLWLFTSVATLLVAWFTVSATDNLPVSLPLFVAAGIGAMAVSSLHVGRISRIWRAASNFRSSWISREIVLFSVFFGGAILVTGLAAVPSIVVWAVVAAGFASLFAMDMVYRVPGQPVITVPHSAMATVTGAYYVGLMLGEPILAVPAAAAKLALYLLRRHHPSPGGGLLAGIRITLGLILPCLLLAITGATTSVVVAAAAIGELIDRAEFYANLRFLTPKLQFDIDLATRR